MKVVTSEKSLNNEDNCNFSFPNYPKQFLASGALEESTELVLDSQQSAAT